MASYLVSYSQAGPGIGKIWTLSNFLYKNRSLVERKVFAVALFMGPCKRGNLAGQYTRGREGSPMDRKLYLGNCLRHKEIRIDRDSKLGLHIEAVGNTQEGKSWFEENSKQR